jgi:transcription antitermination factor NusG
MQVHFAVGYGFSPVTDRPEGRPAAIHFRSTMLSMERLDAWQGASHPREKGWYACYTRARHEKQVDRLLKERLIESFLPLVRRTQQWKDRKKQVPFVLFPSYTFARFSADQFHQVISIPGIASIVRNNGRPVIVPDAEITNVRLFAEALSSCEQEASLVPYPQAGDRVLVTAGPFKGVCGVVIERRHRARILIGLRAINWGMQVEVCAAHLETGRI